MSFLGRGLDSLIPERDEAPEEDPALDVLSRQGGLSEPIYKFHQASAPVRPVVARVASELPPVSVSRERESQARGASQSKRSDSIFWIPVVKIEPNPHQPRRQFDVGELTTLARSIGEHGVLQPLLVTRVESETGAGLDVRYQLIAGERRWRAAKMAGLRDVPVMVREGGTSDVEKLELALIENLQREDLNAVERAKAFADLMDQFGLSQQQIAEAVGKSREVVANALRLLRLPGEMQSAISGGVLTEGHARLLLMLESDRAAQSKLFREMKERGLSVRDAELMLRAISAEAGTEPRGRRRRVSGGGLDPEARRLQSELEELFGTRVSVTRRGSQGKIVVEFYSDEELRGILDRLNRSGEAAV